MQKDSFKKNKICLDIYSTSKYYHIKISNESKSYVLN